MINQAKGDVKETEIYSQILNLLKQQVQTVSQIKLLVDPTGDVPEQKQLTMVLMHPQYAVPAGGNIPKITSDIIKQIAQQKGSSQRVYRNTILFLLCSEAGRATLAMKLKEYLACNRILTDYSSQLDSDQRKDINDRKRTSEQDAKEQLIHAYSTVAKCVRDEINTYEVTSFAQEMSFQITNNILNELRENSWVLRRIGMNIISRNGLFPTVEKPVSVNELYEAFLRFDDKPMILNPQTVTDTVNRYCEESMWNVGTGSQGHYTRIYHEERIPFLNPQEDGYWLLDPSVTLPGNGTAGTSNETGQGKEPISGTGTTTGSGATPNSGSSTGTGSQSSSKNFKHVTINGSVPIENYSQLFQSFVQTLRYNNLKIEMKFSADSTSQSPLTENSQIVKSIIESASQLGLAIKFEEE